MSDNAFHDVYRIEGDVIHFMVNAQDEIEVQVPVLEAVSAVQADAVEAEADGQAAPAAQARPSSATSSSTLDWSIRLATIEWTEANVCR